MSEVKTFDPHAVIKQLAEVEWKHEKLGSGSVILDAHVNILTQLIVPFASLRVEQRGNWSHKGCVALGHCDLTVLSQLQIEDCGGRGWIAEPDVERACWRVFWCLPWIVQESLIYDGNGTEWDKAVLRAAAMWVVWKELYGMSVAEPYPSLRLPQGKYANSFRI